MICRFSVWQGAVSDFSAHNLMLHLRRKIQVKEERRIGGQIIVIYFHRRYVFSSGILNIFLHYSFAIGVGPEYMCGTRIYV